MARINELEPVTTYLAAEHVARLECIGNGNASAGLRTLVDERDTLEAALHRACADLLALDRAEGDTATAAELAADYAEIARTEAWERAAARQG